MTSRNKRTVYVGAEAARITFEAAPQRADSIGTLRGYAIVWNVTSSDRGGYKVRLRPGSATFTANVHALYHHEFRDVLADTASQTLRILPADDYGIPVEIDLPDTSLGRDVLELVRTGRVRGMSFAMVDSPDAVEVVEDGENILDVIGFTCDETTVTPVPAFTETTIGVKPNAGPSQLSSKTKNDDRTKERFAQRRKLEGLKLSHLTTGHPWAKYPR